MEKAHWKIHYHPKVDSEDIPRIDAGWWREIEAVIRERLSADPLTFGKPLRYSLKGVRSLRVGDYRILYRVEEAVVYIGVIKHRSLVYEAGVERRFGS